MSTIEYNLLDDTTAQTPQTAEPHICVEQASKSCRSKSIFKRAPAGQVCTLTRQLATLLRSGMPLVPALSALVEQMQSLPERRFVRLGLQDTALASIMQKVREDVSAGKTLSAALSGHPDVFSPLFVNMVAAGEAGGNLEQVLVRLAEMLEKRGHLAAKVKAAVAYPVMMVIVAAAVVVFLLSFVVPDITKIFIEMNRALPWPTRVLIAASSFANRYLFLVILAVLASLLIIGAACRSPGGRLFLDRCKLQLPLFGRLLLKLEVARLTRTLSMLLTSGIPMLTALGIVRQVVQNSVISRSLDYVRESVGKGESVAGAVRKTGRFPPIVFHIIATGQISGDIEAGLLNLADMYDGEVEMSAKTLTSLLEPAILLIMGVIVGFIVLAVLLPILEINQTF